MTISATLNTMAWSNSRRSKPCELFDLLQPVDQGVAVDKELPGGLGDVEVVLKEFVNGEKRLLVQGVDGVFLENLREEDLAEGRRQLVDQAADPQVFIAEDALFCLEDLADFNGDLRFFVRIGQLPQVVGDGADADGRFNEQLACAAYLRCSAPA